MKHQYENLLINIILLIEICVHLTYFMSIFLTKTSKWKSDIKQDLHFFKIFICILYERKLIIVICKIYSFENTSIKRIRKF